MKNQTWPVFQDANEERADDNPRDCVIFYMRGYHVYARDGLCRDCAKPNPRPTDNGR